MSDRDDEIVRLLQRSEEKMEKMRKQFRIFLWVIAAMTFAAQLCIFWLYFRIHEAPKLATPGKLLHAEARPPAPQNLTAP
jgi:hypothetical protein